jgi:FixJ family two-component response regulator
MGQDHFTIAVVDDDPSVCRAVARLLESASLIVKTFTSAEKFLDDSDHKQTECVLLDIFLPGMSGFDLQQQLKTSGIMIPIILMTAYDNLSMHEQASASGAFDYLKKPVEAELLIRTVRRALE